MIINSTMTESRQTRQKEILKVEIKKINSFFNADELHQQVKKKDKHLGIATVYRYLTFMTEHGFLHSYSCNRKTIYSHNNKNHCHFTCHKCGKVAHFSIRSLDFLKKIDMGEIYHF